MYWGAWILVAALLFGNGGFRLLLSRHSEVRRERKMLAALQADNARFTKEWAEIQANPAYTEYLIRKNLGYVKKDEVEYRVSRQ